MGTVRTTTRIAHYLAILVNYHYLSVGEETRTLYHGLKTCPTAVDRVEIRESLFYTGRSSSVGPLLHLSYFLLGREPDVGADATQRQDKDQRENHDHPEL